jgi:hypothetical protein
MWTYMYQHVIKVFKNCLMKNILNILTPSSSHVYISEFVGDMF